MATRDGGITGGDTIFYSATKQSGAPRGGTNCALGTTSIPRYLCRQYDSAAGRYKTWINTDGSTTNRPSGTFAGSVTVDAKWTEVPS